MKRGEKRGWKEKKEKDRLYRLFLRFGTPPIIFLAALIVTTSLLSSTSGKLRGMNAPLRSPVGVSGSSSPPWSFGIPYAETSWEDRPGIDATPNTARDFLLLVFASFVFSRFLKGFRGFFNELILCPPHWKYRRRDKTQSFLSLLFSFLLFHFFNPKINLKKKNHIQKFIQKERNSDPSINSNLVFEFFNKLQHKSIEKIRRRLRNRKPRLRILLKDFDYFIRVKKKKKKIKYTQIHGTISRYN